LGKLLFSYSGLVGLKQEDIEMEDDTPKPRPKENSEFHLADLAHQMGLPKTQARWEILKAAKDHIARLNAIMGSLSVAVKIDHDPTNPLEVVDKVKEVSKENDNLRIQLKLK
jgi:hypothetical protein